MISGANSADFKKILQKVKELRGKKGKQLERVNEVKRREDALRAERDECNSSIDK